MMGNRDLPGPWEPLEASQQLMVPRHHQALHPKDQAIPGQNREPRKDPARVATLPMAPLTTWSMETCLPW